MRANPAPRVLAAAILASALLVGCGGSEPRPRAEAPAAVLAAGDATPLSRVGVATSGVLAVSVDGLNPTALARLGAERASTLHRLVAEGASTLDARTAREQTETLPNHTGMLTGRRILARRGGHGVTVNHAVPGTVHDRAGEHVSSVFEVLERHDRSGALFAMKSKFALFRRSWPAGVDRFVVRPGSARLVDLVLADLRRTRRAFRFVHLADPDVAGHEHGFLGPDYLAAVERVDAQLARLLAAVEGEPALSGTTVVLTADHGGSGHHGHAQAERLANHRVPFVVWGAGVAPGTDLYDLNPDRVHPGTGRPAWGRTGQPVRNAEVANLALDLLGLPVVRGSLADARQDLDVR
ncbi:alkaline phosphatase family protein [Nocardioides perillae]|uniref:Type I phosphodiesterase / nucleotide pyrophosphatase n=1 Tax=Nocardioides perillae TaxID=1119534 RepID=A0A7Y9RZ28_9ACTN|nr:hypothetical protein [Nocardioides perillae]